ncbi:MAG: omega-amidase [Planctomycetota bacterium]|jgi:omega-amidase
MKSCDLRGQGRSLRRAQEARCESPLHRLSTPEGLQDGKSHAALGATVGLAMQPGHALDSRHGSRLQLTQFSPCYSAAMMRCAAIQFDVRTRDPEWNLETAVRWIREASERDVKLVVLPELWPCSFTSELDEGLLRANQDCLTTIEGLSAELEIAIAGSAHKPADEPSELPTNRFHVVHQGRSQYSYDKVHLFTPTAEHLAFRAGELAPPVVEVNDTKLTGLICYDLRFPELCRAPTRAGAEIMLVSAQWPVARASHWGVLVRGRAVEGQCFVIATNRTGRSLIGRRKMQLDFPGNSMIAGPDGDILAEGEGECGLVIADLDLDRVRQLRRRVPVTQDERCDLHASW